MVPWVQMAKGRKGDGESHNIAISVRAPNLLPHRLFQEEVSPLITLFHEVSSTCRLSSQESTRSDVACVANVHKQSLTIDLFFSFALPAVYVRVEAKQSRLLLGLLGRPITKPPLHAFPTPNQHLLLRISSAVDSSYLPCLVRRRFSLAPSLIDCYCSTCRRSTTKPKIENQTA